MDVIQRIADALLTPHRAVWGSLKVLNLVSDNNNIMVFSLALKDQSIEQPVTASL